MHRVQLFPMLARFTTLKQTQDPSGARCHDPNPEPLLTVFNVAETYSIFCSVTSSRAQPVV
jgi:hypothetical protein